MSGARGGVLAILRGLAAQARGEWLRAFLLGCVTAGAEIVLALSFAELARSVGGNAPHLGAIMGVLAAAAAVRLLAQVGVANVVANVGIEASRTLRRVGLDAVLRADARGMEPTNEVLTRWLERVPRAAQARQAAVSLAAQSVQALLLAGLVVLSSPLLGLGMLVVLLATGWIARRMVDRVRGVAAELAPAQRRVVATLERASRHTLEIRALGTVDRERERLARAVDDHAARQRLVARESALASASPLLPGLIAIGALAAIALATGLDAARLVAMLYALVRVSSSLVSAGGALGVIAASGPALDALAGELDGDLPSPRPRSRTTGACSVVIDDATIEVAGRIVLRRVGVRIDEGEVVAIVGPSGVGKTTLLRTVLGLLEPRSGRVLLDGLPPSHAAIRVALVGAEPFLFAGTLRENLGYGIAPPPEDRALHEALGRTSASAIASGPDGLDRVIGEGGEGLSTGERQRVALARALGAQPSLLILDEPTSGLDAPLELEIAALVRGLAGSSTVLVATHRPALIAACGRVIEIAPDGGGASVSIRPKADEARP